MPLMEPWYDSFAFPYAPFLLAVQVAAFFIRSSLWRWGTSIACTAAIAAMLTYLESLPTKYGEGVDLGSPIVALWLGVSILLLLALAIRDFLKAAISGRLDRRKA